VWEKLLSCNLKIEVFSGALLGDRKNVHKGFVLLERGKNPDFTVNTFAEISSLYVYFLLTYKAYTALLIFCVLIGR
jgi:hypothetical protein